MRWVEESSETKEVSDIQLGENGMEVWQVGRDYRWLHMEKEKLPY